MRGFLTFSGKEVRESIRTYRALVVVVVFIFAGVTGPLLAHFLPDLMRSAGSNTSGIHVTIDKQTARDAVLNYVKNMNQIPAIVVILLAMGSIAGERTQSFGDLVFSRRVSRAAYILAKFSIHTLVLLGALCIGAAVALYYTVLLFPQDVAGPFILANLGVGMLLLDVLAITILCSTIVPTALGAGGAAFAIYLALSMIMPLWTPLQDLLPWSAIAHASELVAGTWGGTDLLRALAGGAVLCAAALMAAWLILRRSTA